MNYLECRWNESRWAKYVEPNFRYVFTLCQIHFELGLSKWVTQSFFPHSQHFYFLNWSYLKIKTPTCRVHHWRIGQSTEEESEQGIWVKVVQLLILRTLLFFFFFFFCVCVSLFTERNIDMIKSQTCYPIAGKWFLSLFGLVLISDTTLMTQKRRFIVGQGI